MFAATRMGLLRNGGGGGGGETGTGVFFNSGDLNVGCIACSADGNKLIAAVGHKFESTSSGYIYTSTDSGRTWTERQGAGSKQWRSVATSADGTKLIAGGIEPNKIFTSVDSGATWTERTVFPETFRQAPIWDVAMSASGDFLIALVCTIHEKGRVYTSTNGGATWTLRWTFFVANDTRFPTIYYAKLSCSASGDKIVIMPAHGYPYISYDFGLTWNYFGAPVSFVRDIAISSNPPKIILGSHYSPVYINKNLQTSSWVKWNIVDNPSIRTCAISANGLTLVAGGQFTSIYVSTDGGDTWSKHTYGGYTFACTSSTISADGSKIFVVNGRKVLAMNAK